MFAANRCAIPATWAVAIRWVAAIPWVAGCRNPRVPGDFSGDSGLGVSVGRVTQVDFYRMCFGIVPTRFGAVPTKLFLPHRPNLWWVRPHLVGFRPNFLPDRWIWVGSARFRQRLAQSEAGTATCGGGPDQLRVRCVRARAPAAISFLAAGCRAVHASRPSDAGAAHGLAMDAGRCPRRSSWRRSSVWARAAGAEAAPAVPWGAASGCDAGDTRPDVARRVLVSYIFVLLIVVLFSQADLCLTNSEEFPNSA